MEQENQLSGSSEKELARASSESKGKQPYRVSLFGPADSPTTPSSLSNTAPSSRGTTIIGSSSRVPAADTASGLPPAEETPSKESLEAHRFIEMFAAAQPKGLLSVNDEEYKALVAGFTPMEKKAEEDAKKGGKMRRAWKKFTQRL